MTQPELFAVAPSRVGVGECFALKVKRLGEPRPIPCVGAFCNRQPALAGPFNLNAQRQIQFMDDVSPAWTGTLSGTAGDALKGPTTVVFNGRGQGVYPGDVRPVRVFDGWFSPAAAIATTDGPAPRCTGAAI